MQTYKEPARETPIRGKVDVLVLGAGPAGFGAALTAAREGADTLLIEQTMDVGGVATTGLMSHWTGNTQGGLYQELLEKTTLNLTKKGEERRKPDIYINHEHIKTVLLEMLEESGARVLLGVLACDPIMEGDTLRGVVVQSKSGREAILADVVVDATGDGDIAAGAGAEYVPGREEDGAMQPVTLMFQVSGVDTGRIRYVGTFEESYDVPAGDLQTLARKHLTPPAGHVLIYPSTLPGTVTLNMTNVTGIDGTDAESVTKGYTACRRQIPELIEFLRTYVPGFEECYLLKTASQLGIRETRHFKGVQTITEQDIANARVFDDWAVTRAHFNFDVHNITGAGLDATGVQKHFKQAKGYTIPYGCFVPIKVDGLFFAGRNISGTHMAHSNYRVMPICANMGQSVGVAAAMCAKLGVQPRALNIRALQKRLMELGLEP